MAGTDAGKAQPDLHGAGPGIESPHRAPAKVLTQRRLEGLDLRTGGDPAAAQNLAHPVDGGLIDAGSGHRQEISRRRAHECCILASVKTPAQISAMPASLGRLKASPNSMAAAKALTT